MNPQIIWITLNHKCNLGCRWCYQREVSRSGREMPLDMAYRLVDLSSDLSTGIVVLIGGEPTLHPNFLDVVRRIGEKGMTPSVVTNGTRFTSRRYVQQAQESGLQEIVFSVKGASASEYVESTGVNAFKHVRQAIANIATSQMRHRISVTISASVIANWTAWIEFLKGSEIQEVNFSFEKPVILSSGVTFDDRMLPVNIARFVQDVMYPSLKDTELDFKLEFMCPQCALPAEFVQLVEEEGHAFGGCTVMRQSGFAFDPDGYLLPCNHFVDLNMGKFGDDFSTADEFRELLRSPQNQAFYDMVNMAPCHECSQCEKWSKCGGGCRIFWLYTDRKKLVQ